MDPPWILGTGLYLSQLLQSPCFPQSFLGSTGLLNSVLTMSRMGGLYCSLPRLQPVSSLDRLLFKDPLIRMMISLY